VAWLPNHYRWCLCNWNDRGNRGMGNETMKQFLVIPNELDADSFLIEADSRADALEQAINQLGFMVVENEEEEEDLE